MYNNQSLDERIQGSVYNEGYDYRNEVSGNRYFIKWSPQEDMKFYSKSRYGSPRMLSKSMPRKNKNLARCRINRSLNFDAGIPKTNLKFKSPNTSLDSICCDEEKQLSRSAKIMKALNFGGSPINIGKNRVNKTLNFDFSPSPKRLLHYNGSPCNIVHLNLSTSSPKIGRSLNFESSPAESNISSILGTSIDSIDENQNQTPSQRRRSVKKSLKYLTPQRKTNDNTSDFAENSPMLRSELKEKIDNIIKISTPNVQLLKKSHKKPPFVKEIFVSTPRNLYNDFEDETSVPKTPKNKIQLVPESRSAIKKSHKKEKFPRRLETEVILNDTFEDDQLAEKLDVLNDQRPLTPPVEEEARISTFDINSIKRSHKKEKRQRSPFNRLEDESLDGSIFNYSGNNDDSNSNEVNLNFVDEDRNNEKETQVFTPAKLKYDSDSDNNSLESPIIKLKNKEISPNDAEIDNQISNENPETSTGPSTPKNRIDLLQRVMGSSIKKSHKKLKDGNKKKILQPMNLDETEFENVSVNLNEPQTSGTNNERSTTPENVNSSRLLLPNFSSVKKSHKKDKRSKILTNFARRQRIFSYSFQSVDNQEEANKSDSLKSFNSPGSSKSHSSSPQKRKLSSCSDLDDAFCPLSMDDSESIEYSTANEEFQIFTPIKKKKSAPSRKFTVNELENIDLDNFENVPLTRCETPILDQSKNDLKEENFITPERNIDCEPNGKSTPKNKLTPKRKTRGSKKVAPKRKETEIKVTPKNNRSALELISNINSVKKSHKKEKKGNRFSFKNESTRLNFETETQIEDIRTNLLNVSNFLTPESSLHSNNASETSFKNISLMASKFVQSYELDGSKPSTSYEIKDTEHEKKNSKQLILTPPNLKKTKEYIKIQHSESIKKSHKKDREKLRFMKRQQLDLELSNDGSIFSSDDRMDDFLTDRAISKKKSGKRTKTPNRVSIVINMNESLFSEKGRTPCRSSRRNRNLSKDGSLFGSDEEMQ